MWECLYLLFILPYLFLQQSVFLSRIAVNWKSIRQSFVWKDFTLVTIWLSSLNQRNVMGTPDSVLSSWTLKLLFVIHMFRGRDSSVGIATRYGLDGLGIESRWGCEIFRTRPDRPWGPPSLLYNGYTGSFLGLKRPGRGADNPPPI